LGELAGGVAHDINSPLSSIQTALYSINRSCQKIRSSLVGSEQLTEELAQVFGSVEERINSGNSACEKIVKIVNSVRNNTRNLSGENVQDFYVMSVLEDLKIMINHQLKQANCELNLVEEDKVLMHGDPGKLGQVLTNLIVNAIQAYGGKGGAIEAKDSKKKNNVVITVADNAGGIPEMFRNSIFNKILTTKGTEGTGLGLHLSHLIITGHFGGKIEFKTEEGKGTTFIITIPLKETKQTKEAV
jgi:signal transduction histidine kinase